MVVTSVGGGEILAVVGDTNPRFAGLNRALDAKRQIGSLAKPFVYLTALEIPQKFNLGTGKGYSNLQVIYAFKKVASPWYDGN